MFSVALPWPNATHYRSLTRAEVEREPHGLTDDVRADLAQQLGVEPERLVIRGT
jgi:hypothetical protein